MQDFLNKNILLGISGGIAAYKTTYLIRELTELGATVRVVMTKSALEFITPTTLQALTGHTVRTELFDPEAERAMGHIELARWADYLLIAPASANCLAKMAHGIADDLLSTLYLVAETPVIVCPAMNHSMWDHPATQANYQLLKTRGVLFVGPESGKQACGEEGFGRLSDVASIINALRLTHVNGLLAGREVMITAGPTREAIDPVRYISNKSSGKMGYALAHACAIAGAKVTLISGPTALIPPASIDYYEIETAEQMQQAVMKHLKDGMIFIGAAAVSDYFIQEHESKKIKKKQGDMLTLNLNQNPDIIAAVAESNKSLFTVGFAAETEQVIEQARVKLQKKQLDMIVANQVGPGLGFDQEHNEVTVITPEKQTALPKSHKVRIAGELIAMIASLV